MNILTEQDCLACWEKEVKAEAHAATRTPEEDRERVLHELDEAYGLAYAHISAVTAIPTV